MESPVRGAFLWALMSVNAPCLSDNLAAR